jgi:hypothetical protein
MDAPPRIPAHPAAAIRSRVSERGLVLAAAGMLLVLLYSAGAVAQSPRPDALPPTARVAPDAAPKAVSRAPRMQAHPQATSAPPATASPPASKSPRVNSYRTPPESATVSSSYRTPPAPRPATAAAPARRPVRVASAVRERPQVMIRRTIARRKQGKPPAVRRAGQQSTRRAASEAFGDRALPFVSGLASELSGDRGRRLFLAALALLALAGASGWLVRTAALGMLRRERP